MIDSLKHCMHLFVEVLPSPFSHLSTFEWRPSVNCFTPNKNPSLVNYFNWCLYLGKCDQLFCLQVLRRVRIGKSFIPQPSYSPLSGSSSKREGVYKTTPQVPLSQRFGRCGLWQVWSAIAT